MEIPQADLDAGLGVLTAIVRAGLATSNGEVRRAIANGAIRVNDTVVSDDKAVLGAGHLVEGVVKLSNGRKKHVLLRPV